MTPEPRSPSDAAPLIKGGTVREFVRWHEREHGRERTAALFERLPAELRQLTDPALPVFGLLPSSWYPVELAQRLLELITEGSSHEERLALLRRGTRFAVDATLGTIYKLFFRYIATPEMHARHTTRVWDIYYNTGIVSGEMLGPNESTRTIRDWNGHHVLLCEVIAEALVVMHEVMGCKRVTVTRSCVAGGSSECRFVLRWD